ncbi:hypothetical protein [Chitinimonas lacunae]|uniref:Tetratricopeptide repeat protein n=1 Tax=Chitinimonas lacunae TaxID=1963018 RepID=A0ABV8MVG5_9NEIS
MKDPIRMLRQKIEEAKATQDANTLTALYKQYEDAELPPHLMVDKARAIQLSDGHEYQLESAEEILQMALENDPGCLEAYVELGYFYYAVNDDPAWAIKVFDCGMSRAKAFATELALGKAKALFELDQIEAALEIVNDPSFKNEQGFERLREEIVEKNHPI